MTQQPSSAFDMSDMNLLSRSPESLPNIKSTSPSTIANELYPSWDLLPLEQLHLDTVGDLPDLLPRLAAKYKLGTNDWVGIKQDPRLYLLSEMQSTQVSINRRHARPGQGHTNNPSVLESIRTQMYVADRPFFYLVHRETDTGNPNLTGKPTGKPPSRTFCVASAWHNR